jgi:hypothetical protein
VWVCLDNFFNECPIPLCSSDKYVKKKKKKLTCHPLISFFFLLFLLSDVKVSQKLIVKAYILEAAMAVHSIIIGFDFGTSEDSVVTLKVLYVAYVFHQVSGCVCVFVFCKNIYLYI